MRQHPPLLASLITDVNVANEPEARAIFSEILALVDCPAVDIEWQPPYIETRPHSRMSCYLLLRWHANYTVLKAEIDRIAALLVHPDDLGRGTFIDEPDKDGIGKYDRTFDRRFCRFRIDKVRWSNLGINNDRRVQTFVRLYLSRKGVLPSPSFLDRLFNRVS